MSDDVREIKSRIDIAEIIGDYVPLRRAGTSLKGLCPFHAEKTPSFTVSSERQTFHCFGCGKGGDVFTFLMEIEGLDFREALKQLADRAGVTLSSGMPEWRNAPPAKDLRAVLESAAAFFAASLHGSGGEAARAYLTRRGIDADACRRFGLGWAPASWDALSRHLKSQGVGEPEIVNAGLSSQGERGSYDRFRGRVMFPVRDEMAKIAGFGGRLIDGEGAKYVNSPEGDLFNKRKLLYMLHEAKKTIRERGRAILMEGYMDVIRAHLTGFGEAVASLGTALTEDQATLVKRFTDLCYIVYDADGAGQEAAIRGMYILQRARVEVRVVVLPQGRDPDDVLAADDGAAAFGEMLKKALPLARYHVHARRHDLRTPGKRQRAQEEILTGLAALSMLDVAEHIPAISKGFGILQHELQRELDMRRRKRTQEEANKKRKNTRNEEGIDEVSSVYIDVGGQPPREVSRELDLECALCSLLWQDEELRLTLSSSEILPMFSDESVAGIVHALLSGERTEVLEARWRQLGEEEFPGRLARGNAVLAAGNLGGEHFPGLLESMRRNAVLRRYEVLKPLVLSEEASDDEIREYMEVARKLKRGA